VRAQKVILTAIGCLLLLVFSENLQAQSQKRVIQLSGIIVSADSLGGVLPGVNVYVPKAGRGTSTNGAGFFSMPVLVGDSVVISSVGFVRQHYIVPNSSNEFLTVMVEMVEDVTFLKEFQIMALPTEEMFKEAVLALNIPMDQNGIDRKNLNAELLALMLRTTPMDGSANYRYYIDQWSTSASDKFQPRVNPFLNPFNWARFIRDLKQSKK
jgi:hypothetical protein